MNYLIEFLKNGERINGRGLQDIRDAKVEFGLNGEVTISVGGTKLFIKVSSEISKPYEDRPNEGILVINNDIDEGNNNNNSMVLGEGNLTRIIEKSIRKSNSLDLESLCIVTGKICWIIKVDVNILNFDGNLIDISILGIMINLLRYKLPSYEYLNGEIKLFNLDEKPPINLSILHIPICFTILFFNPLNEEMNLKSNEIFEISVFDCDKEEEKLRDSSLIVTINSNKEIIQLSKLGGIPINSIEVIKLCEICYEKAQKTTEWIKKIIKQQEEKEYNDLQMGLLKTIDDR